MMPTQLMSSQREEGEYDDDHEEYIDEYVNDCEDESVDQLDGSQCG